jgi:hypothetical protein
MEAIDVIDTVDIGKQLQLKQSMMALGSGAWKSPEMIDTAIHVTVPSSTVLPIIVGQNGSTAPVVPATVQRKKKPVPGSVNAWTTSPTLCAVPLCQGVGAVKARTPGGR